jgi:hypothetical protein
MISEAIGNWSTTIFGPPPEDTATYQSIPEYKFRFLTFPHQILKDLAAVLFIEKRGNSESTALTKVLLRRWEYFS